MFKDDHILMTVIAGEAVELKRKLSNKELVKQCMNTLKNIFKDEVGFSIWCLFCFSEGERVCLEWTRHLQDYKCIGNSITIVLITFIIFITRKCDVMLVSFKST